MQKLLLLFCFAFLLQPISALCQPGEDALPGAVQKLPKREKAYVHFDKSIYAPGETVWFKIYLMDGSVAAAESKSVYIDWADKTGKLLSHDVYPVVEGGAAGAFQVPGDYKDAELNATVYTRWMLNFDSALLCRNRLLITPQNPNLASSHSLPAIQPQIAFFPEGGNLVAGLTNRVAFKANDQYGRPLSVTGVVKNAAGKEVASFASLHNGMGVYNLLAAASETYTAEWQANGKKQTQKLPAVMPDGVALSVFPSAGSFRFVVNKSATHADAGFLVVGAMGNTMLFKAVVKKGSAPSVQATIGTSEMPSGILTVTVLDEQMKAVAERIVFINNYEYLLNAEVGFKKLGTSKRAKNSLVLVSPDSIPANYSLSVTGLEVPYSKEKNIVSAMLLTGDLKGDVYQPAYYFSDTTTTIRNHLDLVMLTHGWRKYNWKQLSEGGLPQLPYAKDTGYLVLSGRIMGLSKSQLRELANINLLYRRDTAKGFDVLPLEVNPDGSFYQNDFALFDTMSVFYSFPKGKSFALGATVKFMDSRIGAPEKVSVNRMPFYSADTAGAYLNYLRSMADLQMQQLLKGTTLENVTVTTKKKSRVEEMDKRYSSPLFSSHDAMLIDPEEFSFYGADAFDMIVHSGKMPGLRVVRGAQETQLIYRDGSPLLYLDEVQTDASLLQTIPVSTIAFIKAIRPPASSLMGGKNGAIVVYTKRGSDREPTKSNSMQSNIAVGYSVTKEFYQPNYSTFKPENEKEDGRRTLLWIPGLISKPGQSVFELDFFNNDVSTGFRIVLQGMSADGRLISITKEVE